jgi:dolichol-phosphate mannosyltransferase
MLPYDQKLLIILPAYNEEESLPALLHALDVAVQVFKLNASILVINDGSSDATAEIARAFKGYTSVEVYDQIPNQGLAQAVRTGFALARQRLTPNDLVLVMDADNTHPSGLMGRMVQTIFEGADVVIASRYQTGARVVGLARFRVWLSIGASWLFRLRVGLPGVRDYTCGYRVYRCSLLFQAMELYGSKFIQQKGFACMAEILIKLKPLRPIIVEVPMILRYDLKGGDSKMRIWRTIKQTLRMLAAR